VLFFLLRLILNLLAFIDQLFPVTKIHMLLLVCRVFYVIYLEKPIILYLMMTLCSMYSFYLLFIILECYSHSTFYLSPSDGHPCCSCMTCLTFCFSYLFSPSALGIRYVPFAIEHYKLCVFPALTSGIFQGHYFHYHQIAHYTLYICLLSFYVETFIVAKVFNLGYNIVIGHFLSLMIIVLIAINGGKNFLTYLIDYCYNQAP